MNTNIKYKINHKEDLITRHLKYLFDKDTSSMLKILAVEFLYQYRHEDKILEKLKFFQEKEKDPYLKKLLKDAIEGKLENYLTTDFDQEEDIIIGNGSHLSADQIALMRFYSK
jgi:hypothetical protein